MHQFTLQELEEHYDKLPEILKEAMTSTDVADAIFEIGKRHEFSLEETGILAEEISFVILGLIQPPEFTKALALRLQATPETAEMIVREVNHEIFFPLREALKIPPTLVRPAPIPTKINTSYPPRQTMPAAPEPATQQTQNRMPLSAPPAPAQTRSAPPSPVLNLSPRPPLETARSVEPPQRASPPVIPPPPPRPSLPPQNSPSRIPPIDLRSPRPIPPPAVPRPPVAPGVPTPESSPAAEKRPATPAPWHGQDPYRESVE